MFADDIVILVCHDNFGMCQRMIQANFDTLTEWCHDNGIVINGKKNCLHAFLPAQYAHPKSQIKYHLAHI